MKLVGLEADGKLHLGAVQGDTVVDLQAVDSKVPADLAALLKSTNGGNSWSLLAASDLAGFPISSVIATGIMTGTGEVVLVSTMSERDAAGIVLRPGGIYVGSTFAEADSLLGRIAARAAGIRRFETSELRAWLQRIGFSDYEDVRLGGAFVFRVRRP